MSATNVKRYSGDHDFQLGVIRNARVHTYDTLVNANADAANANGRFCFVVETNRFYMGRSNIWLSLESFGIVATPANLPDDESDGAIYITLSDSSIGGGPNIYVLTDSTWTAIRDNGAMTGTVNATSSQTLTSHRRLFVNIDSTSGSFNLTVPATALNGDKIYFKDLGGALSTNRVYLVPGTQTIDGLSTNLELTRDYQCVVLQFIVNRWVVLSDA